MTWLLSCSCPRGPPFFRGLSLTDSKRDYALGWSVRFDALVVTSPYARRLLAFMPVPKELLTGLRQLVYERITSHADCLSRTFIVPVHGESNQHSTVS